MMCSLAEFQTFFKNIEMFCKNKTKPNLPKSHFSCFVTYQYSSEEEEVDLQTALTGYQTKHRKLLEPVDHGKIEYEPYRKNFYVEVPELAKMTLEGNQQCQRNCC